MVTTWKLDLMIILEIKTTVTIVKIIFFKYRNIRNSKVGLNCTKINTSQQYRHKYEKNYFRQIGDY